MKIKAFFTAFVLLLFIAVGVYRYTDYKLEEYSYSYGSWTSEVKYKAGRIMQDEIDQDTLLILGSSELQHQKKTPYHVCNVFRGQETFPIVVGAGYYQSLFHATLVAAMEQRMERMQVVLILAPQWFRKSGIKAEAYASRFSEDNYIDMLSNPRLTKKTKEYIADRTEKLLKVDPAALKRVLSYRECYLEESSDLPQDTRIYRWLMEGKDRSNVALRLTLYEWKNKGINELPDAMPEPDFEGLRRQAALDGEKACGGNPFYVSSRYYENYIVKVMDEVKDEGIKTGYSVSPEYDDLECFLQICSELSIEPLLVITPVNGYWYDWIGFNAEAREDYYSKIRALAAEYGAETADFSDREYEKYFMEDTIHIGWKGWVDVSEAIYRFAEG